MKLSNLSPLMARRQDGGLSFARFRADAALLSLQWPDDVLEQFLFDTATTLPSSTITAALTCAASRGGWRRSRPRTSTASPAVSKATPRTRCTGSPSGPQRSAGTGKSTGRGCARRSSSTGASWTRRTAGSRSYGSGDHAGGCAVPVLADSGRFRAHGVPGRLRRPPSLTDSLTNPALVGTEKRNEATPRHETATRGHAVERR